MKVNVYHDGSHFIANLGGGVGKPASKHSSKVEDPVYDKFIEYYGEAIYKKINKKERLEYIQWCFIEDAEDLINDVPSEEELEAYYKRYVSALHKRRLRFRRKAYLNEWTWWTTFTYDDKKLTQDEFEHSIRCKLSDLCSHFGWLAMIRWEEGELNSRTHLHALLYVPEGTMPGEMFLDHQYSYKRRRQEYFTNNTYFAERFGKTVWEKIEDLKNCKSIINYMLKYIEKNDGKIIYSRGIPDHLEAELDIDRYASSVYEHDYSLKAVLFSSLFQSTQEIKDRLLQAFDFDALDLGDTAQAVPI